MAFGSMRLRPGVSTVTTPTLNEAGIQSSNLIRFRDGLVEKMGGWSLYYGYPSSSYVRALHAWQDVQGNSHVAVGSAALSVITSGVGKDLTPQKTSSSVAVAFSTTNGSPTVTVTDTGSNMTTNDAVVFQCPVSVGGLLLFGAYPVAGAISANQYTVNAIDLARASATRGQTKNATATVASGGAVPTFTTANGSFSVTVTLADHGLTTDDIGAYWNFPVSTTGNGVTISGAYPIIDVPSTSTFVIYATNTATATSTFSMNSGNVSIDRWIAQGPGAAGTGYGVGTYGSGGYGTGTVPASHSGTPITATDWDFDNWGSILLAQPKAGPVFYWDPAGAFQTGKIISQGPVTGNGMFVAMPQRQIIVYGAESLGFQDPLLVRWCDVDDYTTWYADTTNQAGSYRLPRGSKIVSGLQTSQQALLWTDLALWAMQYIDGLLVWGFNEIGTGCGLLAKKARAALGSTVYWMGRSNFFRYSGSGIEPVQCSVWDNVFQDLDTTNADKIRCAANSMFNEVSWFYPSASGGSGEIDSCVTLKVDTGEWTYTRDSTFARTAWIDQSIIGPPMGAGLDKYIYQHESGRDAGSTAMSAWFETGWFMLNEGEEFTFVDWLLPDFKWGLANGSQDAQVQITVYWVEYPVDGVKTAGPFTVTQLTQAITDIQLRGRMVKFRIGTSDLGSFWRIGNIRYQYAPDGTW